MKYKSVKIANIKTEEKENIIKGYASHFNNKDSHGEIITQGAFKKTLQENMSRIKVLWQHSMYQPIGKPINAYEDEKGLYTESKIANTDLGKNAMILARDGVIDQMSIGFYPVKEEYDKENNIVYIKEIKLMEYSLVTFASNPLAQVTDVKHIASEYKSIIDTIAQELLNSIKALVGEDKPSKDTLINNESQNIDAIITELKKYTGG